MDVEDELRASRARIAAAGLAARRRFERALHDGVQQDLVALSIGLQLLLEQIDDPRVARETVEELRRETGAALDRVRDLADELYPSLLDAQGLPGAARRHPHDVEAAVALCARTAEAAIGEEQGRLVVELRDAADATGARDLLEAFGADVTVEAGLLRAVFPP